MLFTHRLLQRKVLAGLLFPKMKGDGFKSRGFKGFKEFYASLSDKTSRQFSEAFVGCEGHETPDVTTVLASTGQKVTVDLVAIAPTQDFLAAHPHLPGQGLHIVNFPAAFDYYESIGCLTDNSLEAKTTGATVHTFNYPGIHRSKDGRITEFNDLVNTGIAVVNKLLLDGVHPDKIVLQGDCYGTAVAFAVQQEFAKKDIKVRLIASNTFGSFKDTADKNIRQQPKALGLILTKSYIRYLLKQTGWSIKVGADFIDVDPYKAVLQREDDKTLGETTLLQRIAKYIEERAAGKVLSSKSKRKEVKPDTCPEEYKEARKILKAIQLIKLKPEEKRKEGIKLGAGSKLQALLKPLKGLKSVKSTINQLISLYIAAHDEKTFTEQATTFLKTKNSITSAAIYRVLKAADIQENQDKVDAHPLSLHQFDGAFEFIAKYLELSNDYIKQHPQSQQKFDKSRLPAFKKTGVPLMTFSNCILQGIFSGIIATTLFLAIVNPVVLPFLVGLVGSTIPSLALTYSMMTIGSLAVFGITAAISSTLVSCLLTISKNTLLGIKNAILNISQRHPSRHKENPQEAAPEAPTPGLASSESDREIDGELPSSPVLRPMLRIKQAHSDVFITSSREDRIKQERIELLAAMPKQASLAPF